MKTQNYYPEELTIEQVENYPLCVQFCEGDAYKSDLQEAQTYAKKVEGEIYTMVDGDLTNEIFYVKGIHYINRIGYAVLKHTHEGVAELCPHDYENADNEGISGAKICRFCLGFK